MTQKNFWMWFAILAVGAFAVISATGLFMKDARVLYGALYFVGLLGAIFALFSFILMRSTQKEQSRSVLQTSLKAMSMKFILSMAVIMIYHFIFTLDKTSILIAAFVYLYYSIYSNILLQKLTGSSGN